MGIQKNTHALQPFNSVFTSAILVGALTRLLEVYFSCSSPRAVFLFLWQAPAVGPFGIADLLTIISALVTTLAAVDLVCNYRSSHHYLTLVTCLVLIGYTGGINYFSASLIDK